MKIVVNGEDREFEKDLTLLLVIRELKIEDKVMAAAVNMRIIKKENWSTHILFNNDKVELLNFVGGG